MTEHAVIALGPQMVAAISALSALGVAVLMDDYGAGYSSLGMLAELPIAGIKCDRLFVRQLPHDRRRQKLLRHISALARDLGLSVVVEGAGTHRKRRPWRTRWATVHRAWRWTTRRQAWPPPCASGVWVW